MDRIVDDHITNRISNDAHEGKVDMVSRIAQRLAAWRYRHRMNTDVSGMTVHPDDISSNKTRCRYESILHFQQ